MLGDDDVHCCVMAWNLIYLIKIKLEFINRNRWLSFEKQTGLEAAAALIRAGSSLTGTQAVTWYRWLPHPP